MNVPKFCPECNTKLIHFGATGANACPNFIKIGSGTFYHFSYYPEYEKICRFIKDCKIIYVNNYFSLYKIVNDGFSPKHSTYLDYNEKLYQCFLNEKSEILCELLEKCLLLM
jgi:hypothetical protein